jgi:prepilin-type N-terminal cleavage/methylation domain-containing protein
MRDQRGFTLVEVLIAASLALVIFSASLALLDAVNRQWVSASQRDDAQNQARLGIDRIVRQLRNIASPLSTPKLLERATPYDIVFQTIGSQSGANATGAERVRYCVPPDPAPGIATKEVVISETQTWSTATPPPDPWSSDPNVTLPCPDSPMPDSTAGPLSIVQSVTNRYAGVDRPVFLFNNSPVAPTDLSTITSVQIDLFANPTPTAPTAETELRSSAFLRNQLRPPVAQFSYTPTGNGGVVLNGGSSYSPDGYDLTYTWSCATLTGGPCPSAAILTNANEGLVSWQPGSGTYALTLTVAVPSGLTSTQTQNVTVP